ncbi:MAG: polysaccharide deacetylase family protein [Burkholderiales bacterium]
MIPSSSRFRAGFTTRSRTFEQKVMLCALAYLVAVHLIALALFVAWPQMGPSLLAFVAAHHGVLLFASLSPRSRLIGSNLRRLPAAWAGQVALTFDDGPDLVVTPKVLEILSAYRARATFFCIGERAAAHPDIIRAIVAAGHRVENHSQRHVGWFAFFGPRAMARDIERAQTELTRLAGEAPVYFRAPAGMRNPLTGWVLAKLGLQLVSWTRRGFDTLARDPQRVLKRLTRDLDAGDILVLHDGAAAREGTPIVLQVLPKLLERIGSLGLVAVSIPRKIC